MWKNPQMVFITRWCCACRCRSSETLWHLDFFRSCVPENPAHTGFSEKESSFVDIKEGWLPGGLDCSPSLSSGVHEGLSKPLGSQTCPFLMFQMLVQMRVGEAWPRHTVRLAEGQLPLLCNARRRLPPSSCESPGCRYGLFS